MSFQLNEIEVRALGALVEKDVTTPDYYPLSLNALVNACNQKNNRDPVMSLDEDAVRQALSTLQEKRLAGPSSSADGRVSKYEHRLQEMFNFTRGETAVLCVLLLRGPQTPGELRGRTERMHRFETLDEVQSTLQRLMQREEPLARILPRQPGTKESRYMHLLAGDILDAAAIDLGTGDAQATRTSSPTTASTHVVTGDRIVRLEEEVTTLQAEVAELRKQLEGFRRQFE